ncbi:YXWGXW repeat-containing protein [Cupriavidus numazuensis]|uniref:Uncharacterized protein n=1 Tax=Cupriavidus numazuensis TaxID=221992 RepID=A0ABM8TF17_9BURK|nr:YXWGXW repeat-containing protein [Cupriavidus numazuensis]CAG2141758.1 hypothetical protein LMG26411_02114 [Cupriavidus numazuensis]
MKRQILLAAAVLAAGGTFGLLSPAQAHDGPPAYSYGHPPPPPRYEPRPPARPGQAWVPGHWVAGGGRYDWRGGYWQAQRPGYRYVPDRWVQSPRGWVMRPGHWAR